MRISAFVFIVLVTLLLKSPSALAIPHTDNEPGESSVEEFVTQNPVPFKNVATNNSFSDYKTDDFTENPLLNIELFASQTTPLHSILHANETLYLQSENETEAPNPNLEEPLTQKIDALQSNATELLQTERNVRNISEPAETAITEGPIPNLDEPLTNYPDWLEPPKTQGIMLKSYYNPNSHFNPHLAQSRLPQMIVAMSNLQQDLQDHIGRDRIVFEDIYARLHTTKTGLRNADAHITNVISKTDRKLTSNFQHFEQKKLKSNSKFDEITVDFGKLEQHYNGLRNQLVNSQKHATKLHNEQKSHIDLVEKNIESQLTEHIANINNPNRFSTDGGSMDFTPPRGD